MTKKTKGGKGRRAAAGSARDAMAVSESGVEVRHYGNDFGTAERRLQVELGRIVETVEDKQRAYAVQVCGTIDRLFQNGTIGLAHADAADRFHKDFQAAAFDALRAMPLERRIKGRVDETGNMAARARVAKAMARLGGHAALPARALWFVVGCDDSIRQWARRERMGHGRPLNEYVAKGFLVAALVVLEVFYAERC